MFLIALYQYVCLHVYYMYQSVLVYVCLCLWRREDVNSYQSVFATGIVIMAVFDNCAL